MVAVSDKKLIMQAYMSASEEKPKKKKNITTHDIFGDGIDNILQNNAPDAAIELAKKKKKNNKYKTKPVSQWNFADFLKYLNSLLSIYSLSYERTSATRDRAAIGNLYDTLVMHFKHNMNNVVLKQYLEWWTNVYAQRMHDKPIYIKKLENEEYIKKFVARLLDEKSSNTSVLNLRNKSTENIDDAAIFELGGLSRLVIDKGIVAGYRMLKQNGSNKPEIEIKGILRNYSKDMLVQVMKTTIEKSPYPYSDRINFIELAKPTLELYGLVEYLGLNFEEFFEVLV